jgi:hypothetical protein
MYIFSYTSHEGGINKRKEFHYDSNQSTKTERRPLST